MNMQKRRSFFTTKSDRDISVSEMRKSIASVLPKYMIPTVFVSVEELPRNTNGKIDRLKLKEMT